MSDAVAHNQIFYLQNHVVAGDLVEYRLGDFDVGSLVFDNHSGTQILVEKNRVTALFCAVEVQLYLVGQ